MKLAPLHITLFKIWESTNESRTRGRARSHHLSLMYIRRPRKLHETLQGSRRWQGTIIEQTKNGAVKHGNTAKDGSKRETDGIGGIKYKFYKRRGK